ncbi:MAG: HAD family hydrolase [Propionibacteriaceae bacterium]|nr:HAD family hydrolase [Propionibacteriaceae bacterium]
MPSSPRRILLLDIDGTLVNYSTELPASAADAVRRARANGHQVYLCTGRARAEIYPELWELGVDGMIGGNGSYVEHDGQVIHHQVLAPEVVDRALGWLEANRLGYFVECNSGLFASDNFPVKAAGIYGEPDAASIAKIVTMIPVLIYTRTPPRDDVNKISFVLEPAVDLEQLAREFEGEAAVSTWSGTGKQQEFGEIGQLGVHKGVAVQRLAEHLGIGTSEMIGFGDALPDLELLRTCGTAVAMGNAPAELAEIADLVTDHVDDDGLANAFRQLGLI